MDRYFVASKTIDLPFKVPNEEFSLKTRKQVQNFIINYKIEKREPAFFFHCGTFRTRKKSLFRTAWRQNCTWDLQQSLTRRNASTPRTMQLDFIFLQDQRNAELVEAPAMPEDDVDVSARKSLLEIDPLDPLDLEGSLLCSTKALEITVMSTAIVDREKFFRSEAPLSDHFGLRTEIELSG